MTVGPLRTKGAILSLYNDFCVALVFVRQIDCGTDSGTLDNSGAKLSRLTELSTVPDRG